MDFLPTQVVICQDQVDLGPYLLEYYNALVDSDITETVTTSRVLSSEMVAYLNQYVPGWRLLRRIEELRHHPGASPYKIVYAVLQLATDTDAETVASRLRKDDYVPPYRKA